MKIQNIKEIILGPRQLTFGFDNNARQEQDLVVSCIVEQFETHGQVILDKFIPHLKEQHDLTEIDALQYIFWSAHELKIHFRSDGKNIVPFEAKQILLKSPEKCVEILTNKVVKDSIFQDVTYFYQKLFKGKNNNNFNDQYDFACSLLSDLKNWETSLNSFKPIAQKPFYPGNKKINEHLQSLKIMLARQDSYSIIYTCYNNKEKIAKMADNIKIFSTFYPRQVKFWEVLIKSIEKFRVNLTEIKKNSEIFADFNRLTQLLASPSPYNLITEADRLLKTVQKHNDQIVQKRTKAHRMKAISKIEAMIEKLVNLFDSYNPGQDMRNKFLYALRSSKKQLLHTKNIKQIDLLLCDTEDMVDDFVEELE
ncbi:hypothetical protein [Desulfobacula sp.]|uniref:hypothetical protein n=1 Tax=Desulfobacula sp. TaxID=2593537 RepID=UPI0025C6CD7B|nr:hypothetical protein [Desulfobacula sp.]